MFARYKSGAGSTRTNKGKALLSLGPMFILLIMVLLSLVPVMAMAGESDQSTGHRQGIELTLCPVSDLKEDQDHTFELDVVGVQTDALEQFVVEWDFGDQHADSGNPDTVAGQGLLTASHHYTKAGTYELVVSVTDLEDKVHGTGTTVVVRNVVPEPEMTITRSSTFEDEVVTFSSLDSWDTPSDLSSLTYSWTFPGQEPTPFSEETTISRTYTETGRYSLTLRVMDDDGDIGTLVRTFTVDNQPPLAMAGADIEVYEDEVVHLTGKGLDTSSDMDGLTFEWDLGDGTKASGSDVDHAFARSGEYHVRLTAMDTDGSSTTDYIKVTVLNAAPVAVARILDHDGGSLIDLDGSMSTDSYADIPDLLYRWMFDDGTEERGKMVTHRFSSVGDHTVTLRVEDDDGAWSEDTVQVQVTNVAPVVQIVVDTTANEDEAVSFDGGSSYDIEGAITELRWDLGDGNTAEGYEVTHSYQDSGVYTVRLTVKDEMGIEAWDEKDIRVVNPVPRPAIIGDKVGNIGREMVFDASTTEDNPSDRPTLDFKWDYDDGRIGHGQMVTHVFDRAGEYKVVLTVTDDDGAIGKVEHKVTVLAEDLMALIGSTVLRMDYEIDDMMDGEEGLSSGETFSIDGDVDLVTDLEGLGLIDKQDIEVMVLVLETGIRYRTNADEDGSYSLVLKAPEGPGQFTILMVATLEPLRSEVTILAKVMRPEEPVGSMVVPATVSVISATAGLMAIGAIGGTDIGRYKFFTLMIPLFTRIKKPKVLDHFERGRIYEHVRKNPGDSYSSIRRTLNMKNGALAHHLRVLEVHEYIISKRDGMFKRFYPKGMKIPEGQHKSIQQNILEMIMSNPRISQKAISEKIGVDRSTVNYHVKILMAMGVIRSEKEGRVKYYYFVGVKEPLPYSG